MLTFKVKFSWFSSILTKKIDEKQLDPPYFHIIDCLNDCNCCAPGENEFDTPVLHVSGIVFPRSCQTLPGVNLFVCCFFSILVLMHLMKCSSWCIWVSNYQSVNKLFVYSLLYFQNTCWHLFLFFIFVVFFKIKKYYIVIKKLHSYL